MIALLPLARSTARELDCRRQLENLILTLIVTAEQNLNFSVSRQELY